MTAVVFLFKEVAVSCGSLATRLAVAISRHENRQYLDVTDVLDFGCQNQRLPNKECTKKPLKADPFGLCFAGCRAASGQW